MDFEPTYTAEQEAFRTEVQDWLRDNIRAASSIPPTPSTSPTSSTNSAASWAGDWAIRDGSGPRLPRNTGAAA